MKKIFTFIAVALMAIGANAKTQIDFSSKWEAGAVSEFGNWAYVGMRLANSEPAKNEEAKTADDSNVTYFDASAYDYLCIKYRETSAVFRFILQYNCKGTIGQYGTEFHEVLAPLTASTSGVVGIKLDAAKKNTIFQIALQSEGTGSIIVDEIYWATEAEYNADVAENPVTKAVPQTKKLDLGSATQKWNDNFEYNVTTHKCTLTEDNAGGWWIGGDLSDYDYLVFEVEDLVVGNWAQFSVFGQGVALFSPEGGSFTQVIDIREMNRNLTDTSVYQYSGTNIVLQGNKGTSWTWKQAYFATAKYITDNNIISQTTGIQKVKIDSDNANAVRYNMAGQQVGAGYKGIVIENGKKMVIK